jgi:hypothetical protein
VDVKGDGESAVVADGLVYVNMEDTSEVVTFDPKTLTVKNRSRLALPNTNRPGVRREDKTTVYWLP